MRSTRTNVTITLAATTLVGGLIVAGPASAQEPAAVERDSSPTQEGTPEDSALHETPLQENRTTRSSASALAEVEDADREPFDLVGVTWAEGEGASDGLTAQVRVRQDGDWTEWVDLEVGDGAAEQQRAGTEPLWVGESDGVRARVTSADGAIPADVRVVTVDGGEEEIPAAETPAVTSATDGPSAPSVISRTSWGAGSGGTCDSPVYGKLRGVMIHHTAGSNSYSKSQSASIVRSIQSYHVGGQGWCDIGYNFLVDKYGQIFEGRKGGWTRMVRGAHAGNFEVNKSAVGISMMGNYDEAHTATAQRNAVVRLVAWRLGSKDLPAKGSPYKIGGETMQRIAMHRDISATACPGRNAVNWVQNPGGLRDRVANAIS